ncbi:Tropomyosin [Dufourea novaeangliae]|uniref:Tropomyosin n=1 Tax=Dufourea novaeangliae TaxID=178035 RepID=A0A154PG95_DUFNO|nr:Tropomyosin [Dufourea novaeangliae]
MDAIKKKMQGMKLEKDNAMDRALLCEQQARDANARAEKAEEEARALQKKIQTIENELDQTQEALMQVNAKLEEKDKALQNMSRRSCAFAGATIQWVRREMNVQSGVSTRSRRFIGPVALGVLVERKQDRNQSRTVQRAEDQRVSSRACVRLYGTVCACHHTEEGQTEGRMRGAVRNVLRTVTDKMARGMEPPLTSTTRRRGHQHHPRHATRRRLDTSSRGPAQCGPAGIVKETTIGFNETSSNATSPRLDEKSSVIDTTDCSTAVRRAATVGARWLRNNPTVVPSTKKDPRTITTVNTNIRQRLAQCSPDVLDERHEQQVREKHENEESYDSFDIEPFDGSRTGPHGKEMSDDEFLDTRSKDTSPEPEHAVARARGDGNSDDDEDPELVELAKLRCPSERAEVQAEREARRRRRCADYPGLAFGSSIFSSETMIKFRLIKNELQNTMGNQLKRVSIA